MSNKLCHQQEERRRGGEEERRRGGEEERRGNHTHLRCFQYNKQDYAATRHRASRGSGYTVLWSALRILVTVSHNLQTCLNAYIHSVFVHVSVFKHTCTYAACACQVPTYRAPPEPDPLCLTHTYTQNNHVSTLVHAYTCMHVCIYTRTHVHTHKTSCEHSHAFIHTYACMHACIKYVCMYIYIYIYIYTHTHTYKIYVCICIYIHTDEHTSALCTWEAPIYRPPPAHVCMCMCVCVCMSVCAYVCICLCICIRMCIMYTMYLYACIHGVCIHKPARGRMYSRIYIIYIYIYIYVCMYVCMYVYTHIHTNLLPEPDSCLTSVGRPIPHPEKVSWARPWSVAALLTCTCVCVCVCIQWMYVWYIHMREL